MNRKNFQKILYPALTFFIIILVWNQIVFWLEVPEYLIPSPSKVACTFNELKSSLIKEMSVTLLESVLGFIIGVMIGTMAGILFSTSRMLGVSFYPYIILIKAIPIIAIAPMLIIWFGSGLLSKVAASALICFFPAVVNTLRGLNSINQDALDLFNSLHASKWQVFTKLRLPTAIPYIFSAMRICAVFSVVGAIVGEFVGSKAGLGFMILIATYKIDTATIVVASITAGLLAIFMFLVVAFLERTLIPWSKSEPIGPS